MAQANEVIAMPKTKTLMTNIGRAPKRSMAHPIAGERTKAANAPALTDPLISVRLQPNSWDSGKMKIVSVVILGAMRAKTAVADAPTTTHP